MAKKRPEDPPKGAPAWQSTFSDLMNLLLCFFVLLFSMSTVDAEKFQLVIASLSSSISIMPAGGTSIGDGKLVGAGGKIGRQSGSIIGRNGNQSSAAGGGVNETRQEDQRTDNEQH